MIFRLRLLPKAILPIMAVLLLSACRSAEPSEASAPQAIALDPNETVEIGVLGQDNR
ncbi:MAG: hypothetical protein HC840_12375 [Leptolyngbyaceae cyanobacterium RM2_2_4]|nr:hypothetical protein [Leptolyngbyaceae cyanobacterium SM1_4_3]NJN89360.1 hypothetical protein [Leptolyngbyaceae cyanobacterium SL_5_14]NJO50092.1 hypothetical protein [Leptolyngbyaceae cyanobacterium RM2_2_4]